MADRRALFKAAKAQRSSSTALTKEQIKNLKAQKAKVAAEAASEAKEESERKQKHEAALAAASTAAATRHREANGAKTPKQTGVMPPPAPRPRASSGSFGNGSMGSTPAVGALRPDSQLTYIGRDASVAPEPAGQSNASSGAIAPAEEIAMPAKSDERSVGSLPAGFFDQPAVSGGLQESVGTGELVGSTGDMNSEVASALARGGSAEAISAPSGPVIGSNEGNFATSSPVEPQAAQPAPPQKGPLPSGFFENKEADAKARGVAPARKKTKEEEYSEFMASIASDVKEVEAREQEEAVDAASERAAREAFEQRMRLQRIQSLKEGQKELPDARAALQSEADFAAVDAAALQKPSKRRRLVIARSSSSSSGEEDGDAELDWRAKGI